MQKQTFRISGMTCAACSNRVEKAVKNVTGVEDVSVNLLKNSMFVVFDESKTNTMKIIESVEHAGYKASLWGDDEKNKSTKKTYKKNFELDEFKKKKSQLISSIVFVIPLIYVSMGHMLGLPLPSIFKGQSNAMILSFTQFLLVIPIVFINISYFKNGFKTLLSGSPNMDSLIAIGSGAAILYGIYAMYKIAYGQGHGDSEIVSKYTMDLYFESAGMILTLVTLGKTLESRAKGKTTDAIKGLVNLTPKTAILDRDGVEVKVKVEEVVEGDILVIKAGDTIPVDGVVVEGVCSVDESAITGESLPLQKKVGDKVIGASINKLGFIKIKATKVGNKTTLAQIIQLVDQATNSKAKITKIADKVSSVFVPCVLVIAFVSFIVWLLCGATFEFAMSIGISVLVVSCPCALGLATPTAIMVGIGQGAKNGILIKSAQILQQASKIDVVMLDKTGTITYGTPKVTDIITIKSISKTKVLQIAYSIEALSEHPYASAIINKAGDSNLKKLSVDSFKQLTGMGLAGRIDDARCVIGNKDVMREFNIKGDSMFVKGDELSLLGKTPIYVALKDTIIGIIGVFDVVKPTSATAVKELKENDIEVVILTGDNKKTADAIQKQVKATRVVSDMMPQEKESQIVQYQKKGTCVAMVGDGINDSPALARADVGIAIAHGRDIAIDAADIVLMNSDLLDVSTTIQLSRAIVRNIYQNLFWAFIYNIIGIPIAAGVFYSLYQIKLSPMIAACAMSLSSLFVVTNALRLKNFKPKHKYKKKGVNLMTKVINIEGMSCMHCVNHVKEALTEVEGVKEVQVSLDDNNATVDLDSNVDDETLKNAVINAGYEVVGINIVDK